MPVVFEWTEKLKHVKDLKGRNGHRDEKQFH